jgi:hypothetical protein
MKALYRRRVARGDFRLLCNCEGETGNKVSRITNDLILYESGDLKVEAAGSQISIRARFLEWPGLSDLSMRIGYAKRHPLESGASKITSLAAAGVIDVAGQNRVETIEYVPLPAESNSIRLDCNAELPGLGQHRSN